MPGRLLARGRIGTRSRSHSAAAQSRRKSEEEKRRISIGRFARTTRVADALPWRSSLAGGLALDLVEAMGCAVGRASRPWQLGKLLGHDTNCLGGRRAEQG